MQRSTKGTVIVFGAFMATSWWWMSWNSNDSLVAGEYVAKDDDTCNELTLKKDHSFEQTYWRRDRSTDHASGEWRRFGEAGVVFSTSFLGAAPEAITQDNVYGMLDNTLGYHTLNVRSKTKPIMFHKRFVTSLAACK